MIFPAMAFPAVTPARQGRFAIQHKYKAAFGAFDALTRPCGAQQGRFAVVPAYDGEPVGANVHEDFEHGAFFMYYRAKA